MHKIAIWISISICSILIVGCVTLVSPVRHSCELVNESSLKMFGPVDEKLLLCAENNISPEVSTITVSSFGGDTQIGRKIGYLIGRTKRKIIVEGACLSSCGNYFIPAATELVIKPGGFIGLHGTPDPYTINKQGLDLGLFQKEFSDEQAFSEKFMIRSGWRLYRDVDHKGGMVTHDMTGEIRPITHQKKKGILIVERLFIETCLPNVTLLEEHITESVLIRPKMVKRINALGGVGSGSLACIVGP